MVPAPRMIIVGACHPDDGARAADDHRLDGMRRLAMVLQPQQLEPVRQQRLVDHHHVPPLHPHRAIILPSDFHKPRHCNGTAKLSTSFSTATPFETHSSPNRAPIWFRFMGKRPVLVSSSAFLPTF